MADAEQPPPPERSGSRIPLGQRLYDRIFLLLFLGILVMVVVYTGWGLWELVTMPAGTLP